MPITIRKQATYNLCSTTVIRIRNLNFMTNVTGKFFRISGMPLERVNPTPGGNCTIVMLPINEVEDKYQTGHDQDRFEKVAGLKQTKAVSIHDPFGDSQFIDDDEIISVEMAPKDHKRYVEDIAYGVTEDGRHVLQQPGMRACVATTVAMLTLDHNANFDVDWVSTCNLSNLKEAETEFGYYGLRTQIFKQMFSNNRELLCQLVKLLEKNGPGIVSVNGELGGHVIIVDKIDLENKKVLIREPWHGWSIEIKLSALIKRMPKILEVLQVIPTTEKDKSVENGIVQSKKGLLVKSWKMKLLEFFTNLFGKNKV